jgi:hypothetical protein
MLRNYLTESGTLTCIQGNDAYAPLPYWDTYSYRSLTTDELNALKNNIYDVTAFTLASGQYTCLEVTVSGSIFLGALRCYFGNNVGNYITAGLAIEQSTDLTSTETTAGLLPDGAQNPSTTDAIPPMTSANSPSPYIVSGSSQWSNEFAPFKAFDKDPRTRWSAQSGLSTGWLRIDCGVPKVFNKYRFLSSYYSSYPPLSWTIQGSNDGVSWQTVDTQTDFPYVPQKSWSPWVTFVNSVAYRYYMMDITASYSTSYLNIAELHFVESTSIDVSSGDYPPYVIPLLFNNYLEVEDIKGPIAYWKRIGEKQGYFESEIIPFIYSNPVNLVGADYFTTPSNDLPYSFDVVNKSFRQIIQQPQGMPISEHLRLNIAAASDGGVEISHVSVAPAAVTTSSTNFDTSHVQDHAVRGRVRHWVSDLGNKGHFEGDPVYLDIGQAISGTWLNYDVWQGTGVPDQVTNKQGYSIRQLIPGTQVITDADGIKVTLQSADEDIVIRNLSYMPATSTVVKLDFQTNSTFEQINLQGPIIRWKNDGWVTGVSLQNVDFAEWAQKLNTYVGEDETDRDTLDYLEIEESAHFGHFEGPEVDFDDGQAAIMYDANVIGFRSTNHGLAPGDYISVEGTEYYDGHYVVLTYSTASIVVIWGIYDPEVFTSAAKMRKIISLGPVVDDYGAKQDARDVVPYVQVNFLNGHTAYILNYSDYGKGYASVEISSVESNTEVVSIYDVFYDNSGYLSSSPGPSVTPAYKTSMPDFSSGNKYFEERNVITRFLDLSFESDDPGSAYDTRSQESWAGDFFVICEPQDPEFEGDWTGWEGMSKFFDRRVAQPWYTLIKDGCPWVSLCYRGPMPVKFGINFGNPRIFSKYRLWIQLWLCPASSSDYCPGVSCSKPKSWKFQATNTPDDESSWVTLEQVVNYDPDLYTPSLHPLDRQIPGSCGTSSWFSYPTLQPYQYYRLYVYDAWVKQIVYGGDYCSVPVAVETSHICEMDFCEHRTAPGVFPTIITSEIVFDKINQVIPNENMHLGSTCFYALSFDDGSTWSIYEQDHWKVIAKEDNGLWKYYRGYWRTADENNARKALWHAFSAGSNRMTASQIADVPATAYHALMTSGCYPRFGVGLVSNGYLESMLDGITVYGIAYNPVGTQEPQEFLFDGETGCTVSGGYQTLSSDWLNITVPKDYDILLVADIDSTSGALSRLIDGYEDYRYFERSKFVSYDEQRITISDFTAQSGVTLLKEISTRSSDLVIFPATDNHLEVSDWVTITGTVNYNKLYNINYVEPNRFGVTDKHTVETVVAGAYARPLITVSSPTSREPDIQVGSVIEFSDTGYYTSTNYKEIAPSGLYWVTENVCQPGKEATQAFDTLSTVEFHSGRPIDKGPVMVGLYMTEQRSFTTLRIQASNNYYYWDIEFPKDIEVSVSNESSPSLTDESLWTPVMSGECTLPIGPKRFTEGIQLSASGAYYNYRFKINSIHGESNFCTRFSRLEYLDSQGPNIGYTVIDAKQGFDARYLFDGTTYSQYVSKYPMSSGVINIGIDYRDKPVQITGFTLTSAKDSVTAGRESRSWRLVSPKTISFWASTSGNPQLEEDADWVKLTQVDYDKPGGDLPSGGEGVTGPLITIPYSPKDSVRHSEGYTVAGNTQPGAGYLSVDLSWGLDNNYVVDKIGLYSTGASHANDRFKLCKNVDDLNWEIEDICAINHPGGGWAWFTLLSPLKIPAAGNYHLGIWSLAGMSNFQSNGLSGKNFRYASFNTTTYPTGPTGDVLLGSFNTTNVTRASVQYMSFDDFPASATNYKLKVESVWGGSSYHCEFSGIGIETTDGYEITSIITYEEGGYPIKLLDLPAYHQVTGLLITVVSGMQGGYTETGGNPDLGSSDYPNSFWTLVDRHWDLDNGKAISSLGIDSDLASNITFKIFKDSNGSGEWYDAWDIATFTHSGGGFQWFTLTNPYEIPSDGGTYHLGWYQPNSSRLMGDYTGAQLVSYQYGNYTGTNINLPLHSTQRPHLAVRYGTYFTVGTDENHTSLYAEFSPGTGGRQYVGGALGPFTTASAVYLYRPTTPVIPDTQGVVTYTFYYEDTRVDNYDAWPYTISGSPSFESAHFAQHAMDGDPNTFFYSYRKLDETQHLYFMVRFDDSAYVNAYRLQASVSSSFYLEHFPSMITVGGANEPLDLLASEEWDELYFDDGFLSPRANGVMLPWVYIDDYTSFYRYYRFDLCHSNYAEGYSSLGELYLLVNQPYIQHHSVDCSYNVIKNIVGSGIDPSSVEMLYHPGVTRNVQEVYNTFTYRGRSEPSPGSYFYYGDNNLSEVSPTPERIIRDNPDNLEDIPFTSIEMSNSNVLAWHVLDEVTGDFDDYSGNGVTGIRVGPVLSCSGKRGNAAYISDDNIDEERNVQFTLPHHLTEYTVAFWFRPGHTVDVGYNIYYDIMGGWVSYGAIPGVWHISYYQDLLFDDSPYPYLQYKDSHYASRLVFGNYGKAIFTGRYRWPYQTWHHIAFAFRSDGSMKAWVDGSPDSDAKTAQSNVYPGDSVIMVDPEDIHYTERNGVNCTYFGLPLKGSDGVKGEFAIDHVMHFNKFLSDDDVFNMYRLKYPSIEPDGVYFARDTLLEVPGRTIIDFGRDVCITKAGLRSSDDNLLPGPEAKWRLEALDSELGWITLSDSYETILPYSTSLERKEVELFITASGTFPRRVFQLNEDIEKFEIHLEVLQAFKGGYYTELSDPISNTGQDNFSTSANTTYSFAGTRSSTPGGVYISGVGLFSNTPTTSSLQFKVTRHFDWNIHSAISVGASGISHPGTGMFWYQLPDPFLLPTATTSWDIGFYTLNAWSVGGFIQDDGERTCHSAYKVGNIGGEQVTNWTGIDYNGETTVVAPKVCARYSPFYSVGIGGNMLMDQQLAASGIVASWSGSNYYADDSWLYLYSTHNSPDTSGILKVRIVYYERGDKPEISWTSFLNTKAHQYYGISFDGLTTCATGINIASIHFAEVPIIPCVSGNYTTTTSGIESSGHDIAWVLTNITYNENVDVALSRNGGGSWVSYPASGIDSISPQDFSLLGSGDLTVAHTFHSLPSISGTTVFPYTVAITDWNTTELPVEITFGGNSGATIPAQTLSGSDYIIYTTSGLQLDMFIFDVSNGKVPYTPDFRWGYLEVEGLTYNSSAGGELTSSGVVFVESVICRHNEVVSLPVPLSSGINTGDIIDVRDATYSGLFSIVSTSGDTVAIEHPLYSDTVGSESYARKLEYPPDFVEGCYLSFSGTKGVKVDYTNGYVIHLASDITEGPIEVISNSTSWSGGTQIAHNRALTDMIGGEAVKISTLGMTSNTAPLPYQVFTDYDDAEELIYYVTQNNEFPYKLFSIPSGVIIDSIGVEVVSPAVNAFEYVGIISAGDQDTPWTGHGWVDLTLMLDPGKELMQVGFYTTTAAPYVFAVWEQGFTEYATWLLRRETTLVTGNHTGNGAQYFPVNPVWSVPTDHGNLYLSINAFSNFTIQKCLSSSAGSSVCYRNAYHFPGGSAPSNSLVNLQSYADVRLCLQASYRAQFSLGYDSSHPEFFVPAFTAASGSIVAESGPFGPYGGDRDVNVYFLGDVMDSVSLKVTINKKKDTYRTLDGDLTNSVNIGDVVVDVGQTGLFDSYRLLLGQTCSGLSWSVFGSNTLPYWDTISGGSHIDTVVGGLFSPTYDLDPSYHYYAVKFSEAVNLREIQFINKLSLTSGVACTATSNLSDWEFTNVARISRVDVNSTEPAGTSIYHLVTFDGGNTYKYFDVSSWIPVIQVASGQWYYYNGDWVVTEENTKFSALRSLVNNTSFVFSSIELEQVEESEWHSDGGLLMTSGSLGFMQYFQGNSPVTPRLDNYSVYYLPRVDSNDLNWYESLVPSGYGYTKLTQSGAVSNIGIPYRLDTGYEYIYGRKETSKFRLYLANPSASGIPISEIALLNVQLPDHPYYTPPFTSLAHLYPIMSSGVQIPELHDEHVFTGGILITEKVAVDYEIQQIPPELGIYVGELRVYFDESLDRPNLVSVAPSVPMLRGSSDPMKSSPEFPITNKLDVNQQFSLAFDGNSSTYCGGITVWSSSSDDFLLDIYFPINRVSVSRFRFRQTDTAALPKKLYVEASNDYVSWDRLSTHTYSSSPGNYNWCEWRHTGSSTKYCYWRFRVELTFYTYYNGSIFSMNLRIGECEVDTSSESSGYFPVNASGISFFPSYDLYDDHYSVKFLSEHALDNLAVRLANGNTTGSGLVRPTELAIFSYDSGNDWEVPDEFNHLESADTTNSLIAYSVTSSGIPWVDMTDYAVPAPFRVYERVMKSANSAWRVFEPSDTAWTCTLAEYPWYVTLDTGDSSKGYRVNRYRIRSGNSGYWSSSWKLEGSNDNSTWVIVDSRSSITSPVSLTWTVYYNVVLPAYYRYYRMTFLTQGAYLSLAQIDLRYDSWTPTLGQQQTLSTPFMERLFDTSISGAVPVLPNHYISLESVLRRFGGKSKEIRAYTDSGVDFNVIFETQSSGVADWTTRNTSWSGDGYFYSNLGYETVTASRVSLVNLSPADTHWVRSVQIINAGDEIDFGATGSGERAINLPTTYARYEQMKVYNNNRSGLYADARVLPRFSNNYHLDRLALISEDQVNWSHLDVGTCLPEDYEFSIGKFVGTEMCDSSICLQSNTTSGHWISPIIEVIDPSSSAAYIYCKNLAYSESYVTKDFESVMNVVEVRASNTKPMHTFLVTGIDTSTVDGLQYPWKMVAFNSDGATTAWTPDLTQSDPGKLERGTLTQEVGSPRRYWDYTDRVPLWQFYGFIDSRRYGSISLGQEYGGWFNLTEEGYSRVEDWYASYNIWPYTTSKGSNVPGFRQYIHKYPRTNSYLFPVFNQSLRYTTRVEGGLPKGAYHFVDAILRNQPFYERYQENYYSDKAFHLRNIYTFRGNASTPEKECEIDYLYSFPGEVEAFYGDAVRFGACLDNHSDTFSYWAHYAHEYEGSNYYKTLLVTDEKVEKEFDNIELKLNYLVEGSYSAPRGFWGLAERSVYWVEYDGGNLVIRYQVSADSLGKEFKLVTFGNVDYNNNLWFVDLVTERVVRVNFEDLSMGLQAVDYTRSIDGAISVYPDPYDGSAYVYVIRDPEFPDNDCMKIVHVGDYDYVTPETVCIVPGISLVEPYNVNLYGRSTFPHGDYEVLPTDPVWADNGTATWERYSAGSPTLPKGHYKQLKVTLRRRDLMASSPEVEYIRIPKPALLNKIPWKGYRDIFIDTLPRQSEVDLASGDYTLDLLIWWPRE